MKVVSFQPFVTLEGINGASGLVIEGDRLLLIADDSPVLYSYSIPDKKLLKISLSNDGYLRERLPKIIKPDFEAIAKWEDTYFIFGSGSAENRYHRLSVDCDTKEVTERSSLTELYNEMMVSSGMSSEDFNIEGVVIDGDTNFYFNRGNGPGHKNGVFRLKRGEKREISFHSVQLPEIKGASFGFTDACRYEGDLYFTASAEATSSTYDDGDVMGSGIGMISMDNLQLKDFEIVTKSHKLEGLAVSKVIDNTIEFIACEDADDDINETTLFKIILDFDKINVKPKMAISTNL